MESLATSDTFVTKIINSEKKIYILLSFANNSRRYIFTSFNNGICVAGYKHSRIITLQPQAKGGNTTSLGADVAATINALKREDIALNDKFNYFLSIAEFESYLSSVASNLGRYIHFDSANNQLVANKKVISTANFVMYATGYDVEEGGGMDIELLELYLTQNQFEWKLSLSFLPNWITESQPTVSWSEIISKPSWIGEFAPTYTPEDLGAAPANHSHPLFEYLYLSDDSDCLKAEKSIVSNGQFVMFSTGEEVESDNSSSSGVGVDIIERYLTQNSENWVLDLSFLPDWVTLAKPTYSWDDILSKPDSMPASDVYGWAKQPTKPGYMWSEILDKPIYLDIWPRDALAPGSTGLSDGQGMRIFSIPLSLLSLGEGDDYGDFMVLDSSLDGTMGHICGLLFSKATADIYLFNPQWRDSGWGESHRLWHSGNSNDGDVDWSVKNLIATGSVVMYATS